MPEGVTKKEFLIIVRAWRDMISRSYDDIKTTAMMGAIQKYIPDFFSWLEEQGSFQKVEKIPLHAFIKTMKKISRFNEVSLNRMIKELEDHGPKKKGEEKKSQDPNDNSNL